jgi:uncharacterized pyridoxal phosphate-containing UPF0001 family protein
MTVPDVARVAASIEAACVKAGRDPKSVRLLAVTKQVPTPAIRQAADLGVSLFAKSCAGSPGKREQGAYEGSTLCLTATSIQQGVAGSTAFDVVHSVDSLRIRLP